MPDFKRQWAVIELSLNMAYYDGGELHPETTPVGPFASKEEANQWASERVTAAGGGSWQVGPMVNPYPDRPFETYTVHDEEEQLTIHGQQLRSMAAKGNDAMAPWSYVPCAKSHGMPNRLCIRPEGHGR